MTLQTAKHIAKRIKSTQLRWKIRPKKTRDLKVKLFEKIKKERGCWIWIGSIFKKSYGNYGQIRIGRRGKDKIFRAHRVSYEHFKGKIPKGLELDHLCKNTLCINPDHLEPVSHSVNMSRGYWATKTKCIYGHPYKNNTYINPRGARECKICRKLKIQKFNQKGKK